MRAVLELVTDDAQQRRRAPIYREEGGSELGPQGIRRVVDYSTTKEGAMEEEEAKVHNA